MKICRMVVDCQFSMTGNLCLYLSKKTQNNCKIIPLREGRNFFFEGNTRISHWVRYFSIPVLKFWIPKVDSQPFIPKACSLLSILSFSGGVSRSCFENWEIFGVKKYRVESGFGIRKSEEIFFLIYLFSFWMSKMGLDCMLISNSKKNSMISFLQGNFQKLRLKLVY